MLSENKPDSKGQMLSEAAYIRSLIGKFVDSESRMVRERDGELVFRERSFRLGR